MIGAFHACSHKMTIFTQIMHPLKRNPHLALRGHNWTHFVQRAIVYCYLEFELRYLENLKLFLIRVKEIFEPLVLQKKKKKSETLSTLTVPFLKI